MRHRLSPAAARDLRGIYRQSILSFGVAQADRYLTGLEEAFLEMALFPEAGSERPEYRGNVRIRRFVSHYVIYRIGTGEVIITRVLHIHQDLARYL